MICSFGPIAYELFKRYIGFDFKGLKFTYLKSTSPANAITFDDKLKDWYKVIDALNSGSKNR